MLRYASELARAAGDVALRYFRNRGTLEIQRKGAFDLVSVADREVARYIQSELRLRFPDDGFLGEESDPTPSSSGRTWIVDPIDGTLNFLRGHDAWAVTIGLVADGRPCLGVVHAPVLKETLSGGQGLGGQLNGDALPRAPSTIADNAVVSIGMGARVVLDQQLSLIRFVVSGCEMTFRRNGCASVSLMMLLKREVDAMLALGLTCWDVVAGVSVASELAYLSNFTINVAALDRPLNVACAPRPLFERLCGWEGFAA